MLAALRAKQSEPELIGVHRWLDNWTGVGLITRGMERQGYRLHLTNAEPSVWQATFISHPMTSAEGSGAAALVASMARVMSEPPWIGRSRQ